MKIRLEMKNYNMILRERLSKYKLYHQGKLISINEQAKFTYCPLGKAFEKQIKTIEDQGKKQIDALADLKPKEIKPKEIKPNKYGDYFIDGLAKIRESYKPIDFNDLTYNFKDLRIPSVGFIKFKGPLHIFKSIHNGDIPLEDIEKEQIELKNDLGLIKQETQEINQKNKKRQQIILKIFIIQDKKLLKCLMIMLGACLKIFMIHNKKEQGLKY